MKKDSHSAAKDANWIDQRVQNSDDFEPVTIIDIRFGKLYLGGKTFGEMSPLNFTDTLAGGFEKRNITPNETVEGWLFLEEPPGGFGSLRFHVREVDGSEFTEPMTISTSEPQPGTDAQGFRLHVEPGIFDISKLPRVFYSTKQPVN